MTIICALHRDGETWVGSDRLRSGGYQIAMSKSKFVFRDGWAIGVAGWARAADVIENHLGPLPTDIWSLSLWLREALETDGFVRAPANGEDHLVKNFGVGFIVANAQGVWDVDAGFACSPIPEGEMLARGTGSDFALGAFQALTGPFTLWAPADRPAITTFGVVEAAVLAAIKYDSGCGGAIFVKHIEVAA